MDEKILQYLDGELTGTEKEKFENELKTSSELNKKFEEYLSVQTKLDNLKNIEFDDNYFNGVIPEFRKRIEIKKKTKKIFSFSFANSLAAIIILYFILKPSSSNLNLNDAVKQWSENDFQNAIEYFDQQYTSLDISDNYYVADLDSVISAMLSNELNLSNNSSSYKIIDKSLDYNRISNQISTNVTDNFYKEILNKKYF